MEVFQKRILPIITLGLVAAACGRDPEAQASTADSAAVEMSSLGRSQLDSAAGYVVASVDTPEVRRDTSRPADSTKPDAARDSTPRTDSSSARVAGATTGGATGSSGPTGGTSGASTGAIDSAGGSGTAAAKAVKTYSVTMAPGRPKRDSLALVYALRKYESEPGWPVKGPAPKPGSILPNKRIIAFYGNTLSKKMGILGELPKDQMLAKLKSVVNEWETAEPGIPVQPALHYISVVAQGAPGSDGKYRLRMDSSRIEEVYGWAKESGSIMFLDIQTGLSTVQEEMPRLMKFLERPDVHFAIDPEFHMHHDKAGVQPGKKIGTLSHVEINYAIDQLSKLVREKGLPPKVLIIHRFTRPMVRGYDKIKLDPNVQVVIHMDGWGAPWLKFDSYKDYVIDEPVQYTGFKLFYKNDTKKGDKLLTAAELVQLKPKLMYIQYQ